ncbi:hypothetical protein M0812_00103 [Anaeramoeba flamelloides]|uniref:Uncharacterized protein n=1 Tax=Anaeramoeba flamelloides TaxID=1746091 RepID=A0AAV8A039_9EUKA|nr:hypothetical protein M0812_00103 [Anaeramoeba flamelloides]
MFKLPKIDYRKFVEVIFSTHQKLKLEFFNNQFGNDSNTVDNDNNDNIIKTRIKEYCLNFIFILEDSWFSNGKDFFASIIASIYIVTKTFGILINIEELAEIIGYRHIFRIQSRIKSIKYCLFQLTKELPWGDEISKIIDFEQSLQFIFKNINFFNYYNQSKSRLRNKTSIFNKKPQVVRFLKRRGIQTKKVSKFRLVSSNQNIIFHNNDKERKRKRNRNRNAKSREKEKKHKNNQNSYPYQNDNLKESNGNFENLNEERNKNGMGNELEIQFEVENGNEIFNNIYFENNDMNDIEDPKILENILMDEFDDESINYYILSDTDIEFREWIRDSLEDEHKKKKKKKKN